TGATTTSYTIPSNGIGASYRVCLNATNTYGTGSKCSDPIGPIAAGAPANTARPTITGSALTGASLTITSAGTWSPTAASYTYQWQIAASATSGWSDVTGATTTSYTIPSNGIGASYRVCLNATNTYGTGSKCSDPIGPIT
ncbi:MAG TPA: hypothetical protein VMF14_14125, partial [Solirubrobacteraceae bacterium]|nr:hypothetical protein [Solirubrobacteraceae bacterium]